MDLKAKGKEFLSIHEDFFQLDEQDKLARVDLEFEAPSEIFFSAVQAGIPVLSEDFLTWLYNAFDYLPDRYKLDINVYFSDMKGYSEGQLEEIFRKNILLVLRILGEKARRRNRLLLILCATGLAFILLSAWLNQVWKEEGTVRDIVFFIMDIIATVPFWGAMDIYLVEGSERRRTAANIKKRFNSISFHRKG